MTTKMITCSMCGHSFDPNEHQTCEACPLKSGCQLTCCPHCGYESVNIHGSRLARLFMRLTSRKGAASNSENMTLANAPLDHRLKIVEYTSSLPLEKQIHLQAYGLMSGCDVEVLQHAPVTIVRIDHTELALENNLAMDVQVDM